MGCGASKSNEDATKITLATQDSEELRKKRAAEIAEMKKAYDLQVNEGLTSWVKNVPMEQETDAKGIWELTKVFYRMWAEEADSRCTRFFNNLKTKQDVAREPFGRFKAFFDEEEIPAVSKDWQSDKEFGYTHLNGLFPHFIRKVTKESPVPPEFRITDEHVKDVVGDASTVAELIEKGRLFLGDVAGALKDVRPQQNYVLTNSRVLFFIQGEAFLPLAICSEDNGYVFTPKSKPNNWLAAKLHHQHAEFQIHTLLVHALTQHMLMEPFWATMNQTMSQRHPLHVVLKPHMWNMVFVNAGVRDSLLAEPNAAKTTGALQHILSGGLNGSKEILTKLFAGLNIGEYFNIRKRYERLGYMDIPNYHFRDESLMHWDNILKYMNAGIAAIYDKDELFQNDSELHAWAAALVDPTQGNLQGKNLPLDEKNKRFANKEQVAELLAMIIYQCAIRHSHVENAALKYYPWVCFYPASFRLKPLQDDEKEIDIDDLDHALPSNENAIQQIALIMGVHVSHDDIKHLTDVKVESFDYATPALKQAAQDFKKGLDEIETKVKARLERTKGNNPVVDDFLQPSLLANSIWN